MIDIQEIGGRMCNQHCIIDNSRACLIGWFIFRRLLMLLKKIIFMQSRVIQVSHSGNK